jgi:hypothetical protein
MSDDGKLLVGPPVGDPIMTAVAVLHNGGIIGRRVCVEDMHEMADLVADVSEVMDVVLTETPQAFFEANFDLWPAAARANSGSVMRKHGSPVALRTQ